MAESEIQSRFSPNTPLEPDILSEIHSILRLHDLSVEDFFFKWESYCIKMDLDAQAGLSLSSLRSLKQNLQDELEKSRRAAQVRNERKVVNATPKANSGGDVFGMLDGLVPSTPATGRLNRNAGGSALKRKMDGLKMGSSPGMSDQLKSMNGLPATSFADRVNPGDVVEVLNSHLQPAEAPIAPFSEPRIKLTAASDQKKMAYKPLAMKLSEASEILDDRIDDFMAIVQDHHKLDDSAFGSAASQSTTEIVAVGRIASDSMEGKLNAASLVLETSRRTGMGLRVPLKMEKIRSWSFFPGQIVALRGNNATGNEFVVNEILEIPLLPNAASSSSALEAHREKFKGGPDAMDAADSYADALILTGPFIDIDHPLIATGDFDLPEEATQDPDTATMSTVFKYLFATALNRACSANPHLTIVLVPSVRDILDKHVSWPQDSMPRKDLGLPKSAKIVSNPMTLSMNEMVIGISSQDILYELRTEELAKTSGDLMGRLVRYLVEQRHYFPLFPTTERGKLPKTGTEEGIATGAVVDVSYLRLGEMVNVRPDVVLVPSSLPPFVKVVESVLAINPGPLSKRKGAGTYARMTLYPPTVDGGDMQSHRIFDRARVEIVRI
ncbi:DNA polymerase alpha/primase associated subunit [Pochonia chlamydosporia 170]|uniref:DNA polymerase alpha subunit B n=1 Tax=Pochonia chlamydosporia 170 TaxID=1380566 RepID=A0A179FI13_METCM|nr:DNA polymerase alpha/primase associated subunit [Pochonia chlamydosporia 170]OAQ64643.1 DNA polymerase alpha/primase associated subunit [Pochonia chlamydosporia 170]